MVLVSIVIQKQPADDENEESSYLQVSNKTNKENKVIKRKQLKKKVTFEDLESVGMTVSEHEFKKLEDQVKSLTEENEKLKVSNL